MTRWSIVGIFALGLWCATFPATTFRSTAAFGQQPPAEELQKQRDGVRQRFPNIDAQFDVEYGKAGDRSLQLNLFLPKQRGEKPLPLIVWIHGGGWSHGSKEGGTGHALTYVRTGKYAGASIGYRLSGEAKWPAQVHDCKAAIRWLRANAEKLNIDPNKIAVWGNSAGGHLVMLLGTSGDVAELEGSNGSPGHSSRVSCVVSYCGVSDFPDAAQDPNARKAVGAVKGLLDGAIEDKIDAARLASPITHVAKTSAPILIVHGTKDDVVPFRQAERLHAAYRAAGATSHLLTVTDAGHSLYLPEISQRVDRFLSKHLLGETVDLADETIAAPPPPAKKE